MHVIIDFFRKKGDFRRKFIFQCGINHTPFVTFLSSRRPRTGIHPGFRPRGRTRAGPRTAIYPAASGQRQHNPRSTLRTLRGRSRCRSFCTIRRLTDFAKYCGNRRTSFQGDLLESINISFNRQIRDATTTPLLESYGAIVGFKHFFGQLYSHRHLNK